MEPAQLICSNCGAPNPASASTCERCGSQLVSAATIKLDPSEVLPGSGAVEDLKATKIVEPQDYGIVEPKPDKSMETLRVDSSEIPPPSPFVTPEPPAAAAAEPVFAPPPPVAEPPKKSNRNVIIGVVVGVFACICLCCCVLAVAAWQVMQNGVNFNF